MIVRPKDEPSVAVDDLLAAPFSTRSPEDRERIVSKGRPAPPLSYAADAAFDDLSWLTASAATGRFYCWPCLLFDDAPAGDWNDVGLSDLALVWMGAEAHQATPGHLQAAFRLQHFDQLNARRTEPLAYVSGNHHPEAARRLTDAACSLAVLWSSLDSLKTLLLLRKYDAAAKCHSDEAIRWLQSSPDLHGRVVAAVARVVRRKVAEAVGSSQYVALVLGRHSEAAVSSVLRYVRHGKVEERFLGFALVPASGGAAVVYEHVRALLRELDAGPKLVALAPDAGVLEAGDRDALLERLRREDAPLCRWAPCHSHSTHRVLQQCLQRGRPPCRKFFACLKVLERSFRDFPELCASAPEAEGLRGALSVGAAADEFLRYVRRNRLLLVEFLESPLDDGAWRGLGAWLRDETTAFLLDALARLSGPTTALGAALRGYVPERYFGPGGSVSSAVSDLLRELRLLLRGGSSLPGWWAEALEGAASEVRARYCDLSRFHFCRLFDFVEEGWFDQSDAYVRDLLACYDLGEAAHAARIRAELDLLWAHMAFSKTSAYDFHQHLHDSHLGHTFRSLFDFSELVLAMPFKHASLDRDTALWDAIDAWDPGAGLPDDAFLLSVEADYLREARQSPGFYDEVFAVLSA